MSCSVRGSQTWLSLPRMFTFWLGSSFSMLNTFFLWFVFGLSDIIFCSVSVEGRLFVWKISEGPDEEGTPQITGKIVIAIQIVGEGEAVHPRVCWHCHKQVIHFVNVHLQKKL